MKKVLGLALYSPMAASTRHRLTQYEDALKESDIVLDTHCLLSDRYLECRFSNSPLPYWDMLKSGVRRLRQLTKQNRYDCAILYCELFPLLPGFVEHLLLNIPYIYDMDDAFFLKYQQKNYGPSPKLLKNKIDSLIRNASAVAVGNDYLAEYARRLNPNTLVLPTAIDATRYSEAKKTTSDFFTVGWIGSPSTATYLTQVFEALSTLGRESRVKFVVVGALCTPIQGVEVINLPWSEDTEIDIISTFDVGIMPLPNSEWARGKCAFKLIQYMACGVPSVASPVGANTSVMTNECGLFATTTDQWAEALRKIRDDVEFTSSVSEKARERALDHFTISNNAPKLADAITSLAKIEVRL